MPYHIPKNLILDENECWEFNRTHSEGCNWLRIDQLVFEKYLIERSTIALEKEV